ncbi:MAG: hypothetical protein ABS93_01190 [Thiobacillus sp. SCN 62-729]|nr:MAG: hypothetical protein ABS93_01190 [Thiobacillus sp. SCN 62-729]
MLAAVFPGILEPVAILFFKLWLRQPIYVAIPTLGLQDISMPSKTQSIPGKNHPTSAQKSDRSFEGRFFSPLLIVSRTSP